MKTLLEFYLTYGDFLYSDSRYRFTDSKTDGINASLTLTGPSLIWSIVNDRGQIQLSIAAAQLPESRFWISLIKQYFDGNDDIRYLAAVDEIGWARENIRQIEQVFSDASKLESTCGALRILLRSNAEKQWGPDVAH